LTASPLLFNITVRKISVDLVATGRRRFEMNKKEIISRMAKDAGLTALQAAKAFSTMMEGIKNSLKRGEKVTFSGFGSFEVKERKARKGRNPKTGAEVAIPPRKRVKFNPSKRFKNSL